MKLKGLTIISLGAMVFSLSGCASEKAAAHHYTDNFLYDENKHWRECTDDNCIQQVDVAIHEFLDWTVTEEATCNKPGKEVSKCSVCDYVLEREIPVKDHDVDPGWEHDEEYHWHTCKNDPEEKVDYNAHSFNWVYTAEPTCTAAGEGYQECTVCGYKTATQTIAALNHSWVLDEEHTTYATCSEAGSVTHVCTRCGATETKTVPAGHGWGQPTYEWNEDYTKVTATRICENNSDHVETETVMTDKTHVSPTCDAEGSDTYVTKAFSNSAFKQQTKVINIEKCSETLEHHCEAVQYTAGDIYDECTLCHKRYNVRTCSAPWVDYYFPTEMKQAEGSDNGAGAVASFDADTKVATLPKHSGKSAFLTYTTELAAEESVGKKYFVMTYTLLEDSGGWWDTYLYLYGIGTNVRTRFGKIGAEAVKNFDMSLVTFTKDGNTVGWNGVGKGETGTLIFDISTLTSGVSKIELCSDGGVQLRIDYAGFKSSQCDHDISCYKDQTGYSCAGLIKTTCSECEECHHQAGVSTTLSAGYSSVDLGNPLGVRWSSEAYDYVNHVVTAPNTWHPGPMFNAANGTKMYAEVSLSWDETVTNENDAFFEFYFMNNELGDQYPDDNMNNHYYDIKGYLSGVQSANAGVTNPPATSTVARYLDAATGEEISTFTKGQKIVLEINIGDAVIGGFARFLISCSNGANVTISNLIYC